MKNPIKKKKGPSKCPHYQEQAGYQGKVNICCPENGRHGMISSVTEETAERFCLTTNDYHNCSVYKKYQTD